MKVLYYDCFAGISGDMNLGALIDLGASEEYIIDGIKSLNIKDEVEIKIYKNKKNGIEGTKVDILTGESHAHRHLSDIVEMIENANLKESVKERAISIFRRIAKAEGKVHGMDEEMVHFHEVGAIDSICDIVGGVLALDSIIENEGIEKIYSSSVELGGGCVICQHGMIPVPAPATLEILKNIPCTFGKEQKEMTTPTGAAFISEVAEFVPNPPLMSPLKVGYGLGTRDLKIPNVVRAIIGEISEEKEELIKLETNIDDMNPEYIPIVLEKLLEAGAKDAYVQTILMKKGRMGQLITVLVEDDILEYAKEYIFKNTTTLGIRETRVKRSVLERKTEILDFEGMKIRVKKSYYKGEVIKEKPEYEDMKKISFEKNLSLIEVEYKVKEIMKGNLK